MLTVLLLKQICPKTKTAVLDRYVEPLNAAMEEWEIDSPQRQAAFLAQVAHESGGFRYVRELASGQDYDTGRKALALGNTPEDDDDGVRNRGVGLIQITGENNLRECSTALYGDPDILLYHPERLMEPIDAARSAGWYWWRRKLNALADIDNFRRICIIVNGGLNGYSERCAFYERAKEAIA